jgi:hypothetical protein
MVILLDIIMTNFAIKALGGRIYAEENWPQYELEEALILVLQRAVPDAEAFLQPWYRFPVLSWTKLPRTPA